MLNDSIIIIILFSKWSTLDPILIIVFLSPRNCSYFELNYTQSEYLEFLGNRLRNTDSRKKISGNTIDKCISIKSKLDHAESSYLAVKRFNLLKLYSTADLQ